MKNVRWAFLAVLTQMVIMALGLHIAGADIETTVLIVGGLSVVACEVAVRLLGRGQGPGGGLTGPALQAA